MICKKNHEAANPKNVVNTVKKGLILILNHALLHIVKDCTMVLIFEVVDKTFNCDNSITFHQFK